jgi:Putative DNA-binding domain
MAEVHTRDDYHTVVAVVNHPPRLDEGLRLRNHLVSQHVTSKHYAPKRLALMSENPLSEVMKDGVKMATTPGQIDLWRAQPKEHHRLEFKEAKTQFDNEKLYRYCVAIANEGGGHLILGVADKPPRPVVGTQAFRDLLTMAEKLFQMIGFRIDIEEVMHTDGRVLVFQIPTRPRGTAYHLDGKYLMRSGEQLVPMSEDQLRRIFAEGEPDWLEEHSKVDLVAQQVVELLDTQTYFELMKLPYPTHQAGVIERLISERLIDEVDGTYQHPSTRSVTAGETIERLPRFGAQSPSCRGLLWHVKTGYKTRSGRHSRVCRRVSIAGAIRDATAPTKRNDQGCDSD